MSSYTKGYKYFFGIHMGICRGPVDELVEVRVGDRTAWTGNVTENAEVPVSAPTLFGGEDGEGGVDGTMCVMFGGDTQVACDELTDMHEYDGAELNVAEDISIVYDPALHGSTIRAGIKFLPDGRLMALQGDLETPLADQWLKGSPVSTDWAGQYNIYFSLNGDPEQMIEPWMLGPGGSQFGEKLNLAKERFVYVNVSGVSGKIQISFKTSGEMVVMMRHIELVTLSGGGGGGGGEG